MKQNSLQLCIFISALVLSAIKPLDYVTWCLEIAPAIIGVVILLCTYKKFQFSPFIYWLILLHCIILFIGGHYTYEKVPLFDWVKETFHQDRNNYDKLGHFFQGFVPALIVREILIRQSPLTSGKWLTFIVISICLAISAMYELIEWLTSLLMNSAADAFLGTQGYIWDTQTDMAWALIGAIVSLGLFSHYHDELLTKYHINNKD